MSSKDRFYEAISKLKFKLVKNKKVGNVKPKPIKRFKIGRNELCVCGSGKKFKYCHIDKIKYDENGNMYTTK